MQRKQTVVSFGVPMKHNKQYEFTFNQPSSNKCQRLKHTNGIFTKKTKRWNGCGRCYNFEVIPFRKSTRLWFDLIGFWFDLISFHFVIFSPAAHFRGRSLVDVRFQNISSQQSIWSIKPLTKDFHSFWLKYDKIYQRFVRSPTKTSRNPFEYSFREQTMQLQNRLQLTSSHHPWPLLLPLKWENFDYSRYRRLINRNGQRSRLHWRKSINRNRFIKDLLSGLDWLPPESGRRI